MQKRVCIIGAGPGGLASAILLASSGVQVTVIERLPWIGGRTSSLNEDGFKFDRGPTFFLYPKVLREIFSAAGYSLDREVSMAKLDPQYRLVFGGGGDILATPNLERMEAEIAKISPADAPSFRRYYAENHTKLEKFAPFLSSAFSGWGDLLKPEMMKLLPLLRPWNSLDSDLKRYFRDPRIRLAFSFQSKYLGMSPFRCPSLFSILSFLEYEHGVFHPIGGCAAVTEAMARVAGELGVEIRTGESVEQVDFQGCRATGVTTEKGRYDCDAVVINADFARAMMRLVPERLRRRWTNRKIERAQYSCSTFMMYLGIDGRYDDVPHHTIYISKDYTENLKNIEQRQRLTEDSSFYVQNASVTDPTLAPAGKSTLYVLVPVPHKSKHIDWAKEAKPFRDSAISRLEKIGIRGVEKRIRYEKVFTPADWERGFELHLGSTFSMAHTLKQMLHLRPNNRFEDVDGVYLVGGGTHPGSGLPVIFESARISSKLLLEDLAVQPSFRAHDAVGEHLAEAL